MINLPELFLPATRGARSGCGWLVRLGRTHQWWLVLRLPRASHSFLREILGLTRNWVVGPGPWAAAMAIQIVEYDLADTFEPFPHEFNLVGLSARIACHPFRVCHTWVRRDPLVQSWLVGHLPLATFSSSPDQLPTTSRACLARRGGWLIWPRSRVIPPVSQSTNKLRKYRKRRSLPMERVRRLVGSANNSGFPQDHHARVCYYTWMSKGLRVSSRPPQC